MQKQFKFTQAPSFTSAGPSKMNGESSGYPYQMKKSNLCVQFIQDNPTNLPLDEKRSGNKIPFLSSKLEGNTLYSQYEIFTNKFHSKPKESI